MLVNRGRVRDFIRVLGNLSLADVKTNKIIGHLLKLDRSGTLFTKPLPLSRVRERESVGLDLLAETHTWFLASIARGGIVTAGVRSSREVRNWSIDLVIFRFVSPSLSLV